MGLRKPNQSRYVHVGLCFCCAPDLGDCQTCWLHFVRSASLLSLGLELRRAVTVVWDFGKAVPEIHSCALCEFLKCAKQRPKEAASNSSQI